MVHLMLDTRRALAEEIEALRATPRLVVQTSPPEGTVMPAGPRAVNVRGLAPPGANVTVNGEAVANERPSGYFCRAVFLGDNQPTVTVAIEHRGTRTSTTRVFKLTDGWAHSTTVPALAPDEAGEFLSAAYGEHFRVASAERR